MAEVIKTWSFDASAEAGQTLTDSIILAEVFNITSSKNINTLSTMELQEVVNILKQSGLDITVDLVLTYLGRMNK